MSDSYWTDEDDRDRGVSVPDDLVDISFRLQGTLLPIDHAWALGNAIQSALPWMEQEAEAAVHQIHVAASGNGWYRPEDKDKDMLHLSRRTCLTLRVPTHRLHDTDALIGQTLSIDGYDITLGSRKTRPLSNMTTLFARYIAGPEDENEFLAFVAQELAEMGISLRKMLCGKTTMIDVPEGQWLTRSLMMADVDLIDAIRLQRSGIGPHRLYGCGIVIPHKGIEAVKKINDD